MPHNCQRTRWSHASHTIVHMYYPHSPATPRIHHFHTILGWDLKTRIWWPTGIRHVSDRYPTASDRYPTSIRQVSDSFRQLPTAPLHSHSAHLHPPIVIWRGIGPEWANTGSVVPLATKTARKPRKPDHNREYRPGRAHATTVPHMGDVGYLSEAVGSCRIPVGYSSDTCRMLSDTCRIPVGYLSATR